MGGLDLERYGQVLVCLREENSLHWTRSNIFTVFISAILGFVATALLTPASDSLRGALILLGVSVSGTALTILWHRTILSGRWWINHWHELLLKLEEPAYGDLRVYRVALPDEGGPARIRMREVMNHTLALFYILWALVIGLVLQRIIVVLCMQKVA